MKRYRFSKYVRPKIIVFLIIILALFASLFILNTPHNLFSSAKELARKCGYEGLTCCNILIDNILTSKNEPRWSYRYTCPNSPDSVRCFNSNNYRDDNLQCKALRDVCGQGIGSPCCDDGTCGSNANLQCIKYTSVDNSTQDKDSNKNPWSIYVPGGFYNQDRGPLTNQSLGICGESNTLPTPKSKLNTCGETDENCCPGFICDIKSPLNACFRGHYTSTSAIPEKCKPINLENLDYKISAYETLSDSSLINNELIDGSRVAVDKEGSGIFKIVLAVSSKMLLQRSQNVRQSNNNFYKYDLSPSYTVYCNNDRSEIINIIQDHDWYDDYASFICEYSTDDLTRAVHLSIIPKIYNFTLDSQNDKNIELPKIERTFTIYEAASVNPNPTSIESLSPSPSPSPIQPPPSSGGSTCTKPQVLCGNKDQFACGEGSVYCCHTGFSLGADNKCK